MKIEDKIKLSRQIMIIAGIFCAFTAILLLLNFWQMKQNDPLESLALQNLVERLASDPNNEQLQEDIRNLDLLARKAYFTSQWQVRAGNYLLLFGTLVFAIALWFNQKMKTKIGKPIVSADEEISDRLISQKWLLIAGGLFILLALGASFLSNDYLELYNSGKEAEAQSDGQNDDLIEVITISKIDTLGDTGISDTIAGQTAIEEKQESISPLSVETTETRASSGQTFEELKNQHNIFRGVFGHGVSYRKNIPVDWNGTGGKNIIWKVQIDKPGYNSPLIWDDKLFLSGGDKSARVVYCYNRNTGNLIWKQEVTGIPGSPAAPPDVTDDTGLAAPSMAVDGTAVFAIFATGDVIAFSMNGKRLWAKNLGVPDNHYGHSSSLLVWKNKLFIQYDTNKSGRLIALNGSDGQTLWDIKRANKISWASPILIQLGVDHQIITTSDPFVAAYDPETGKQLWSVNCMMGEVGPSAAFSDGLVFAANEYAKFVAIQPGKDNAKIIWEDNEYLPEASSPVAFQGFVYLATSYGVIACYDAKTGEKNWEHEAGKGFFSSPVIAEGKLYVIDMGGKMYIFKTGKEKISLGEPELGEKAFATPAFADGRIYLRGEKNLYCIGIK